MRFRDFRIIALASVVAFSGGGCGKFAVLNGKSAETDADADTDSADANAAGVEIPTMSCEQEKAPTVFVASVTQDLFARAPNADEIGQAALPSFDLGLFVEDVFASSLSITQRST